MMNNTIIVAPAAKKNKKKKNMFTLFRHICTSFRSLPLRRLSLGFGVITVDTENNLMQILCPIFSAMVTEGTSVVW